MGFGLNPLNHSSNGERDRGMEKNLLINNERLKFLQVLINNERLKFIDKSWDLGLYNT